MRNHYSYPKQRKPIRRNRDFYPAYRKSSLHQQTDQAIDSAFKGLLWVGYGFALASWFVAVNVVILFWQMLKIK